MLALAGLSMLVPSAKAQTLGSTSSYQLGDLLMGFTEGTSSSYTFVIDLGAATQYRDAFFGTTNYLNMTNINADLTFAFGANWYDNTSLQFGIAATNQASGGNGDPNITTLSLIHI